MERKDFEELSMRLGEILDSIDEMGDLSSDAMNEAKARQEVLAKPTGALGRLEDISIQLAGITGKVKNDMKKQAVVIFSADNGVVEEGVASAPQSVTLSQTINFTRHLTGVSSMAKYWDIGLLVVDVGVKMSIPEVLYSAEMYEHKCAEGGCQKGLATKIVNRRIADGTKNLAKEPAMSREEALTAILTGVEAVEAIKRCGYDIFGVGEMGIGNTTTSACVLAALCGKSGADVAGRGGGLNDEGLAKKIRIVDEAVKGLGKEQDKGLAQGLDKALARGHDKGQEQGLVKNQSKCQDKSLARGLSNGLAQDLDEGLAQGLDNGLAQAHDKEQALDILASVGGFDICAMAGAFLGAAYYKMPVVIDGYISAVAALSASVLAPKAKSYMLGSHQSKEQGYLVAMDALGIEPYFDLGMRLGEGSGCPISFKIIETACAAMNGMATFAEGAIDADYLEEGKKGNFF